MTIDQQTEQAYRLAIAEERWMGAARILARRGDYSGACEMADRDNSLVITADGSTMNYVTRRRSSAFRVWADSIEIIHWITAQSSGDTSIDISMATGVGINCKMLVEITEQRLTYVLDKIGSGNFIEKLVCKHTPHYNLPKLRHGPEYRISDSGLAAWQLGTTVRMPHLLIRPEIIQE